MKKKFLIFAVLSGVAFAGPIENLKPGEWYEVPNSHLDAVKPNPLPPGYFEGLIIAWNSGAYDTKRDRFLVWGGGHCDYAGNEIYAFDVNAFQWSRIWGPTPNQNIGPCVTSYQTYSDGNPSARHIYDGLEYIPDPVDAMMIVGGPWWGSSGGGGTWLYKFATGTWEQKVNEPDGRNGDESAYDPATGHVFMRGSYWISEFDPVNNTWTKRNNESPSGNGGWWGNGTGALDPKRGLIVYPGLWAIYNLETNRTTWPATTGDNGIQSVVAPGVDYDPVSDKMVAWHGGTDVYTLDLDNLTWMRRAPASSNTVTPPQSPSQGTFGRFRYMPSKNAFICVSGTTQNVFIYKLTSGPGTGEESTPRPGSGQAGQLVKNEGQIQISPNPVSGSAGAMVQLPAGAREFSVFDLKGRLVFRSSPAKANFVNRLAPGLYIASAVSHGTVVMAKFAVVR